jgi:hypothetical protein
MCTAGLFWPTVRPPTQLYSRLCCPEPQGTAQCSYIPLFLWCFGRQTTNNLALFSIYQTLGCFITSPLQIQINDCTSWPDGQHAASLAGGQTISQSTCSAVQSDNKPIHLHPGPASSA